MTRRHAPRLLARSLRPRPAPLAGPPAAAGACLAPGLGAEQGAQQGAWAATAHCAQPSRGFCLAGAAAQGEPQPQEDAARESAGNDAAGDAFLDGITTHSGPAAEYKEHRLSGLYKKDARQEGTILKLQELYEGLVQAFVKGPARRRRSGLTVVDHAGTQQGHASWWQGISGFIRERGARPEAPAQAPARGLYMFGGVGTGKTMLMDLLVHSAPPQFKLRRQHFHDFMLGVHAALRREAAEPDPLARVADAAADCTRVLCLDELFVTDVADAAILSRLFGRLWDCGVVLVATSNRHPDELYKGGLQRELFLPFIARLRQEAAVHDMASPVDYRKLAQHRNGVLFLPGGEHRAPDAALAATFADLVATAGGRPPAPASVPVQMGRTLRLPLAGASMCLASFGELCGGNLGAADYIALAGAFHTLALQGVPAFDARTRPAAYRFVTLVDVLYERRVRLFASAAAPPQQLFANVVSQQEARGRPAGEGDALIVDDNLAFSKDRTVSRLTEMGGEAYLLAHARAHAPCLVLALEEQQDPARARPRQQRLAA